MAMPKVLIRFIDVTAWIYSIPENKNYSHHMKCYLEIN